MNKYKRQLRISTNDILNMTKPMNKKKELERSLSKIPYKVNLVAGRVDIFHEYFYMILEFVC